MLLVIYLYFFSVGTGSEIDIFFIEKRITSGVYPALPVVAVIIIVT